MMRFVIMLVDCCAVGFVEGRGRRRLYRFDEVCAIIGMRLVKFG